MAEGCWPKYGALCVKVADGSNRVQGAQPLQVMNESNSLEVKLDTILSLLDPSSSDAFTDEVCGVLLLRTSTKLLRLRTSRAN